MHAPAPSAPSSAAPPAPTAALPPPRTGAPQLLVIDAHPDPRSLCAALAARYADAARAAGAQVAVLPLRELQFDLVLRPGAQALEPDLRRAQALIEGCHQLCLVTPLWWGSVPALLKGFFDRALERGWAYRYLPGGRPLGLLAGRSARVLLTTDSPWWYLRLLQGDPTVKQLERSTLRFCGLKPVRTARFGPVYASTAAQRARWLEQAAQLGGQDVRAGAPRA